MENIESSSNEKSDIYLKGEDKNPEWRESSLSNPFVLG